jgi:hypothetical protein
VSQPYLFEIEYQDPDPITYLYVATGPKRAAELYAREARARGELTMPGDREEIVVRQYPMPWQEGELKPLHYAKPRKFLIVLGATYSLTVTDVTREEAEK